MVALNSRDRYEIIGLCKTSHSIKKGLPEKNVRNASKLLKQCSSLAKQSGKSNILICSYFLKFQASLSTLAKQSKKSNILINSKLLKFQALPKFYQPASLPVLRPNSAQSRPPDFSQVMCNCTRFMNLLV